MKSDKQNDVIIQHFIFTYLPMLLAVPVSVMNAIQLSINQQKISFTIGDSSNHLKQHCT